MRVCRASIALSLVLVMGAACGDPGESGVGDSLAPSISTAPSTAPTSSPPSTNPTDTAPPPTTVDSGSTNPVAVCSDAPFSDGSSTNADPELAELVVPLADANSHLFAGVWWDGTEGEFVFPAISVDEASALLSGELPNAGYRIEAVERNADELRALQERASGLMSVGLQASGIRVWDATVSVDLAVLDPAALEAVGELFADDLDAICVTGADPGDVPADGPQPIEGDGWRLLADQVDVGTPYTVDVATTATEYEALWTRVRGLDGVAPPVDFATEIVIHFGAVYSGSCPEIRLDGVEFDEGRALVTADIVTLGGDRVCTDDANPRAYVVAVDRSYLPPTPFTVALQPDCDWCASIEVTDLSGSAGSPGSPGSPRPPLSEDDRVQILAAAAAYRVIEANSMGARDAFDTVDVVEVLGRATGDGFIEPSGGTPMTQAERDAIAAALAPRTVRFVARPEYGDLQPPQGYAILTLAEPAELEGQLTITTSVWCGGVCAIGGANAIVRDDDGTWTIGDPVGPSWIS